MVKPARVPKQNNSKKNFQISPEENAKIEEKIEALRSEVDSIQDRSKIFTKIFYTLAQAERIWTTDRFQDGTGIPSYRFTLEFYEFFSEFLTVRKIVKDNLEIKSRQDRGVSIIDDKHKMAYIGYQLKHFKRLDELVRLLELLEPQVVSKEQV